MDIEIKKRKLDESYVEEESDAMKPANNTKASKKRPGKNVILSQHSYSTNFSGPEVLFFFDLVYQPQPPPIDMTLFPVVRVLEQILKFLYNKIEGGEGEFTQDGRNAAEIYSYYLKKFKWLSWMKDNDNLNLKNCTTDDVLKTDSCILKIEKELDENDLQKVRELEDLQKILELIWYLHEEYKKNQCKNHDSWKHVFTLLHKILESHNRPKNKSFISLRHRGQAVCKFDYKVPTHLVSEGNSSRVASTSDINIYPDSIYDTTYRQRNLHERETVGNIVIEVYDELKVHQKEAAKKKSVGSAFVEKPARERDAICSQSYRSTASAYLQQSLPPGCRDCYTAKTLTGQHALQLIGLAEEHSRQLRKIDCKILPDDQINQKNPVYTAMGMFLKNEYIVFSKLEINYDRLQSYSKPSSYRNAVLEEGKISFSPWRVDVMEPNHRIALIVALLEILKPGEDQ